MNPAQIAKKYYVTRQSVIMLIRKGRLRARKELGRWVVNEKDYEDFRETRYRRDPSIHDNSKDRYSVNDVAKMMCVKRDRVYYIIRKGYLKHTRTGAAYVMQMKDISDYFDRLLGPLKMKQEQIC